MEKANISEKLLRTVLPKWNIYGIVGLEGSNLIIDGSEIGTMAFSGQSSINIHEVDFRCIEFAKSKGYIIECYPHTTLSKGYIWCVSKFNYSIGFTEKDIECSQDSTKPEAVFKATQWILDNIESEEK